MRKIVHCPLPLLWLVVLMVAVMAQGCATSYLPKVTGPLPFAFTPTEAQCQVLMKEKRDYRATERTSVWIGGSGALVATAFAAVPALRDERAVQGASAAVALFSGAVAIFSGSQVQSLEEEIDLGACLNRPTPPLPTLSEADTLGAWPLEAVLVPRDAKSRP